jgi:diguanylate cyclase (GGDEF)-like protein
MPATNHIAEGRATAFKPPRGVLIAVRAWSAALVAGLLVYGVYIAVHEGGPVEIFDRYLYLSLIGAAAALCLARPLLVRRERLAWTFIGLNLFAWWMGEVWWGFYIVDDPNAPYPSIADALFLASYPLLFVGLALLVRDRIRRFQRTMWVDGAVAALTVGAFAAAFLLPEILAISEGTFLPDATTIAYPIADTLALAFLLGVMVLVGTRADLGWFLLLLSLALLPIADGIYSYQSAIGTYVEGGLIDLLWPLSAVLLAITAWIRPRMETVHTAQGWRSLGTPAVFTLAAGGLLVYGYTASLKPAAVALAAAALLFAVLRLALTYRENQRLFELAQTDGLTRLGNRTALLFDLEDSFAENSASSNTVLVMLDLNGFKLYNDSFGHPAGDALLTRLANRFARRVESRGKAYRIGGDEFCALLNCAEDERQQLVARATAAFNETGEGFQTSAAQGSVSLPAEAETPAAALQLADRRMYANKSSSRSSARSQAHEVLMRLLRERQPELGAHVDSVTDLAIGVSTRLGIEGEELDVIARAAALHDIGKIAIPDAVLNKPAQLDPEEWRFIQDHTLVGERILREASALYPVAGLVRSSHERWDGEGYPDGLAGEEIPLGSRIIFVCDAFQAMTSDRPYAAAVPEQEAVAELRRCAGGQFDPEVVDAFCAALPDISPGAGTLKHSQPDPV